MNKNKKYLLIGLFGVFSIFLILGLFVFRDATVSLKLKREVGKLGELDITKDRYNTEIKSRGDYAIVEKAIKEYMDNSATSLQDVLKVANDSRLTKILSYDNYSKDGENFNESITYLASTKSDFNTKVDKLLLDIEEDKVNSYIDDKIDDSSYRDLYKELMSNKDLQEDFINTKDLLEKLKTRVNYVIDMSNNVLVFLNQYRDYWYLEDGEIKFKNEGLYNEYNLLISNINK